MSEDRVQAKGSTKYPLLEMPSADFEAMNARLIRLEFPEALKPADTSDGGADMALPSGDGYERCWQSKHFGGNVPWDKCKESLTTARNNWNPSHYTFCFPRDLTVGEQKTFDRHFRGPDMGVKVDYWNGSEIDARLQESLEGERVARTFFDDVGQIREDNVRAIEAAGRLDSAEDALDRMSNIGGFLAERDAYFSYPASTHEHDGPSPPLTPGTVMSVLTSDGKITSRVDAVPRDDDAMERYGPTFTLRPAEGEAGERAGRLLHEALSKHEEMEIEGLDITFDRLPPGLKDLENRTISDASVRISPAEPSPRPWTARLSVEGESGKAEIEVRLSPGEPPGEWEGLMAGSFGGLKVRALMRKTAPTGGQLKWEFSFSSDESSARDQFKALRFFKAMCEEGTLRVFGPAPERTVLVEQPTGFEPFPSEFDPLLRFLEDLATIEDWTNARFTIPDELTSEEGKGVAQVADLISRGKQSITWEGMDFVVDSPAPLENGQVVRVEHAVSTRVLGQELELGFVRLEVDDYRVARKRKVAPNQFEVRIEPSNDAASHRDQTLSKTRTPAKKRPPPPPRKSQKGHSRKKPKKSGRRKKQKKRRKR